MYFSSKKTYAYLSVNKSNEISDGYKGPREEYLRYKCPYCGFEQAQIFFPEKNVAVFNKDKVADISLGVTSWGAVSFSQKMLNMIERYNLKGIIDTRRYAYMETVKRKPIESIEGDYYGARIKFEPLFWKNIDKLAECNVINLSEVDKVGCEKCRGNRMILSIPKTATLYLQGLNQVTSDIFSTIDNAGHVFFSERFIEACKKENITNLLDKIVEVYDISELKFN